MVTGAFPTPADTQDYIQILTGPSDDNSLRGNNETNVVTFNVARGTARQAATNFTPVIPAIPASFQTGLHSSNVTSLPINTTSNPDVNPLPAWGENLAATTDYRGSLFGVSGNFQCSAQCRINNNNGFLEIVRTTGQDDVHTNFTLTFTPDTGAAETGTGNETSTINPHTFSFTKPDFAEFGYWAYGDANGRVLMIDTFGTYLSKCQGTETSCQDLLLSVISWISIWS